jgi:hypothetical protein
MTAAALRDWCRFSRTDTSYIEPGHPVKEPTHRIVYRQAARRAARCRGLRHAVGGQDPGRGLPHRLQLLPTPFGARLPDPGILRCRVGPTTDRNHIRAGTGIGVRSHPLVTLSAPEVNGHPEDRRSVQSLTVPSLEPPPLRVVDCPAVIGARCSLNNTPSRRKHRSGRLLARWTALDHEVRRSPVCDRLRTGVATSAVDHPSQSDPSYRVLMGIDPCRVVLSK